MAGQRGSLRIAAAVSALLLLGSPAGARPAAPDPGAGLLAAVAEFRDLALQDFERALERCATPEARTALTSWQAELWPTAPARAGWSFFFGTAVWTATGLDGSAPRVAFYHPWSDVWLLTDWSARGEASRLTHAAVVLGDWLRGDDATFELAPAWLRAGEFAPAALGRATAEALRTFELASAALASGATLAPREPRAAAANRQGAALLLAAALRSARDLALASPGEPSRLTALRAASDRMVARLRAGELAQVAAEAPQTLPATRQAIAALPALERRLAPIHALAVGGARAFVFVGDPRDGDFVLSLLFDQSGGVPVLLRLDLLTFSEAYRRLFPAPRGGSR